MFNRRQKLLWQTPTYLISETGSVLGGITDLDNYLVFEYKPKRMGKKYKEDHAVIMQALKARFTLLAQEEVKLFKVYRITPKD